MARRFSGYLPRQPHPSPLRRAGQSNGPDQSPRPRATQSGGPHQSPRPRARAPQSNGHAPRQSSGTIGGYTPQTPPAMFGPPRPPQPAPTPQDTFEAFGLTSSRPLIPPDFPLNSPLDGAWESAGVGYWPILPTSDFDDIFGGASRECQPDCESESEPKPKSDEDMTLKMSCKVCLTQMADTVVMPCYHLAMCRECANRLCPSLGCGQCPGDACGHVFPGQEKPCPMCRTMIQQVHRVWY